MSTLSSWGDASRVFRVLLLMLLLTLFSLLCLLIFSPQFMLRRIGPTPTPTLPAIAQATPTRLPTATLPPTDTAEPTQTPTVLHLTEGTEISGGQKLGQLNAEYPVTMSPGSTDTVFVSIYTLPQYASIDPEMLSRVEIPSNDPLDIGELHKVYFTVLVAEKMRVELSSPSFEIERLMPSVQEVNINDFNQPTFWAWTVKAPATLGGHVLTLRVFQGEETDTVWLGSFAVRVVEPTATPGPPTPTPSPTPAPSPTPTPLPLGKQIVDKLAEGAADISVALIGLISALCGSLLALAGALAGVYAEFQDSRRQARIKELELSKEKEQTAEKERELEAEINRLKSIKWYQFWKK